MSKGLVGVGLVWFSVLERFERHAPASVMGRLALEHALPSSWVDDVFEAHRRRQCSRELLFSTVVELTTVLVPGIIGWAIGTASGPTAWIALAQTARPMPMPHIATCMTAAWPELNPEGSGNIIAKASTSRTGAHELVVLPSTRPVSAARWICRMTRFIASVQASASRVVEVVKRPQGAKGFVLLPKRWKVEQSFGALTICRRLKVDDESLIHVSAAALLFASITRLLASITMG